MEADENCIALEFYEKKGMSNVEGTGDNGKIIKLVYVHEGYQDERAKNLKEVRRFGSLYLGKEKEILWREVKEYIERSHETSGEG